MNFSPIYPTEDGENEDGDLEDEAELTLEKVEEDMLADYEEDDDEEDNILHMEDLKDLTVSVSFNFLKLKNDGINSQTITSTTMMPSFMG